MRWTETELQHIDSIDRRILFKYFTKVFPIILLTMSDLTDKLINTEVHPSYHSTNNGQEHPRFHAFRPLQQRHEGRVLMEVPPESPSANFIQPVYSGQFCNTRNRLVNKNGNLKVKAMKVPDKTRLYLADLFTTAVDLRWKWVIALFCVSYVVSWIFFGTLWWLMVVWRGKGVCVSEMDDWTTAFLFSIETQQTIGYGSRAISPKCFEGIMLLQIQSILGIFLDAFLLGLTFAKISRPRERARTIKFSKSATIALRDNKMCLMFRVGDIRKSQIVEAHIRAQIFRQLKTTEGKELPFYQQDLRLCYDWRNCDYDDNRYQVFLMLPLVIIHIIDKHSPFYEITPEKLKQEDFEIVVVLDGMVEATGMNTQPKSSYLNDEILWGFDFENVLEEDQHSKDHYWVDFSKFDSVKRVEMPNCSPKEFYEQLHLRSNSSVNSENILPGQYI